MSIGGHQSPKNITDVWLTPPDILSKLGEFDLDPCSCVDQPWPTARLGYVAYGLESRWFGRVWLNPPYGGPKVIGPWMRRMARHSNGIAIIFARTETRIFRETVWEAASAILFIYGRLHFHRSDGTRAPANAGAPSCLVAYGPDNAMALRDSGIPGALLETWDA